MAIKEKLERSPNFYEDAENAALYVRYPKEATAGGLTQLICCWLKWKGHYANRINTQGQARVHKIPRFNIGSGEMQYSKNVQWTKGTTKRGTPDISCIIYGRAVWVEVKVGKDRLSDAQKEQGEAIQEAGGTWFVARDMQSFVDFYYKFIENA